MKINFYLLFLLICFFFSDAISQITDQKIDEIYSTELNLLINFCNDPRVVNYLNNQKINTFYIFVQSKYPLDDFDNKRINESLRKAYNEYKINQNNQHDKINLFVVANDEQYINDHMQSILNESNLSSYFFAIQKLTTQLHNNKLFFTRGGIILKSYTGDGILKNTFRIDLAIKSPSKKDEDYKPKPDIDKPANPRGNKKDYPENVEDDKKPSPVDSNQISGPNKITFFDKIKSYFLSNKIIAIFVFMSVIIVGIIRFLEKILFIIDRYFTK